MRAVAVFHFLVGVAQIAEILGDIPGCDYFDTVDLTNSQHFENGSYQYEDIIIPKDKVALYNYQILFGGEKESVPVHLRGCACQIKSCVRFCCDPQKVLVPNGGKCEDVGNISYNSTLLITTDNEEEMERNVMEFIVQKHLPVPCYDHLLLNTTENELHRWTLFENGSLLRHYAGEFLSKGDYCLQPVKQLDGHYNYTLMAHHCLPPPDLTNAYIQAVSIICLILIIILYPLLPNFKSIHGICCLCYFTCLTVAFSLLNISMIWLKTTHGIICHVFGYVGYYFIMSTFLWLLAINSNLWKTFNNIGVGRRSQFKKYNILVWGGAAFLLAITCLADIFLPEDMDMWKPGVGRYTCWLDTYDNTAMIYYYGPILFLLLCNITLFIKTAIRIFVQNRKNRQQLRMSECQRTLRNLTNFEMFFRLFIIVGVTWIVEILSYTVALNNIDSVWITIFDAFTSAQGLILFIVIILKKDVLIFLFNRVLQRKPQGDTSLASNTTHLPQTEHRLLPKSPEASSIVVQ